MNLKYPILYDINMKKLAILERAGRIGYSQKHNGLWTAYFELPADDPKNGLCQAMRYVELFDSVRVDLFRIVNKEIMRKPNSIIIAYHLEHVLVTLMDSLLYRYHEVGGLGYRTRAVIDYILNRQDVKHWQRGTVPAALNRQFQYSWENENLLAALMSVPKPFDTEYQWTWSTVGYPWTINLLPASTIRGPEVRASRNLREMVFNEDSSHLTTRLYALGQGEGVNQLGIETVNPTTEAYIDADTIPTYGLLTRVWVDRRYEHAENLYETAKNMLEQLKQPRIEVSVAAADLRSISGVEADRLYIGRPVTIKDEDLGIDYDSRVIELSKPDIFGAPDQINIVIANQPQDIAGTIADLANRSRINEVYSQGATNIDSHQLADNCDSSNPMRIKFHIPSEAVFINKVLLNYDISAFRAYSKGAASEDLGTRSISTSVSAGPSTHTTSGPSSATSSGASSRNTATSTGSEHSHNVSATTAVASGSGHTHGVSSKSSGPTSEGSGSTYVVSERDTSTDSGHKHTYTDIYVRGTNYRGHYHTVSGQTAEAPGSGHSHSVSATTAVSSGSGHSHGMDHNHPIPHTHGMAHTHHIAHSHNIGSHSHDITYGIYNGPTPTRITLRVDGAIVPGYNNVAILSVTNLNIVDHLSKTTGGMIVRGWHEVTITPNNLGRANVAIHIQQFLQSRGELRI